MEYLSVCYSWGKTVHETGRDTYWGELEVYLPYLLGGMSASSSSKAANAAQCDIARTRQREIRFDETLPYLLRRYMYLPYAIMYGANKTNDLLPPPPIRRPYAPTWRELLRPWILRAELSIIQPVLSIRQFQLYNWDRIPRSEP